MNETTALLSIDLDPALATEADALIQQLDSFLAQVLTGRDLTQAQQLLDAVTDRFGLIWTGAQAAIQTLRQQRDQYIHDLNKLKADLEHPMTSEHETLIQVLEDLQSDAASEGYDTGYDAANDNAREELTDMICDLTRMKYSDAMVLSDAIISANLRGTFGIVSRRNKEALTLLLEALQSEME